MRNLKDGRILRRILLGLIYMAVICLILVNKIDGATAATNKPTEGTTTLTPETTTPYTTTTTAATTTTSEPATTTPEITTTPAVTTQAPAKQYCGNSTHNGLFVPFGAAAGDTQLNNKIDGCQMTSPNGYSVAFDNKCFKKFHICVNGLVCVQTPYNGYYVPNHGQTTNAFNNRYCMAPFLMNLDTTNSGAVWFHEYDVTEDCGLKSNYAVQKAQELVATETGQPLSNFDPTYVLVATWDSVPRENGPTSETVTFQLVYTSDVNLAYSFYVYKEGGMNVQSGEAFIGQIADGLPVGVYGSAVNDDQYRNVDENLKWAGGDCYGATVYSHTTSCNDKSVLACKKWHSCEKGQKATYLTRFNTLPRCPCSVTQTGTNFDPTPNIVDGTEYFFLNSTAADVNYGKTCGYQVVKNQITFVQTGKYRGAFAKSNPKSNPNGYQRTDQYYRNVCCHQSNLCDLYFDVRPPSENCSSESEQATSNTAGDPHFTTMDGLAYTFNGHGEYRLLDISNIGFSITARAERVLAVNGTSGDATVFTAFVVMGTNFWMQVELNSDRTILVVKSGSSKLLTESKDHTSDYTTLGNSFSVVETHLSMRRSGNTLVVTFPEAGVLMNVTKSVGLLSSIFSLDTRHKTFTSGLLGNFNGDPTDDLIPRNANTHIPSTSNEEAIFLNFGKTWATTEAESQFAYRSGKTHADYNFPDFTPIFLSSFTDEQLATATSKCGSATNKQCIYDLLSSNDETLALGTLTAFDDFKEVTAIAENQIPTISVVSGATKTEAAFFLRTTLNAANTVKVLAKDDGTVTTAVQSDISGIQQTDNADGSVSVTFTLTSTSPVSLSFIATDNLNVASPLITIKIVVCTGCSDHGTCDYAVFQETETANDNFKLAVCTCEEYWEGDNCEIDFNGCAASPCFEGQDCTDTEAAVHKADPSLEAYTCSACPTGYQASGEKCEDINECSPNNPCTEGTCVNTAGSFRCDCNSGYRIDADKVTCNDINECDEETDGCDQICENTVGGFTCKCQTGYIRNAGGTACESDDTNTAVRDACLSAGCENADGCTVNEIGVGVCFCKAGYTLNGTDNTCGDINECDLGVCSQECENAEGSYTCKCYTGFQLASDKVTCNACTFPSYGLNCGQEIADCQSQHGTYDPARGCVCKAGWEGSNCGSDVNECSDTNICGDVNKVCTDTRGSYTCTCRDGFQQQADGKCADFDECADITTNSCEQNCKNTVGAFTCSCNAGYNVDSSDFTKCVDLNECTGGTSGCDQICVNINGGFNCDCNPGYELEVDRKTCKKLEDVCRAFTTKNCSDICNVVDNAPVCSCKAGFQLGADEQTCIDVNECLDDTVNQCTVKTSCANIEGSYTCTCDPGFRLENDRRTCTGCDEFTFGVDCAQTCDCGVGSSSCDPVSGCVCKAGWVGDKCDTDEDECQSNPCTAANERCVNTPGAFECQCKPGYYKDDNNACININECNDSVLNTCGQVCDDTDGSFDCSCNPGFVQDGNNCNDINECEGAHGCEQICTNLEGGFRCSCPDNYQLNDDKRTCSPINECDDANYCSGGVICAQVSGVDTCTCKTGYEFDTGSSTSCVDIKECSDSSLNKCNQQCVEQAGGYACSCDQDGFKLDADQLTCIACEEGTYGDDCTLNCDCELANDNTKSCDKVNGTCTCNSGWEGTRCETNINECSTLAEPCPPNSACVDNDGSYTCVCSTGYIKSGDGTCAECDSRHYGVNCAQTCSCVAANTDVCDKIDGSCTCANGWTGTTCSEDIDECQTQNICNDSLKTCGNIDGSYTCSCITGYTVNSENICIDDNECLIGTHTCTNTGQKCVNQVPSFVCSCAEGFSGDSQSCTACGANLWGEQCANTCTCNGTNTERCDPATGCVCKPGWTGDNCAQDIDECTLASDDCVANAVCTNTQGSFTCACAVGYQSINDTCIACTNNGYGESCSTSCDCVDANAVNSAQSCNHITGRCECKATWTGNRCQTDVDECAADVNLCRNKANQGCHNTDGAYECSCFLGFERDENGTCVISTATSTSLPVPADSIGIDVFIRLNLTVDDISLSDNLTNKLTNAEYLAETERALSAYFLNAMANANLQTVKVYSVTEGSLEANLIVLIANTDAAKKDFSKAVYGFRGTSVDIFGQSTTAQQLRVGTTTINPQTDSETAIKCAALTEANGRCVGDEECIIDNGVPLCRVKTSDNFALVIGLGVGIPLFFITVLIIAVCIVYFTKRSRRHKYGYRSSEFDRQTFDQRGFFPSVMPTKINTLGRNDPVYIPYNWDDQSSMTTSSSDETHKKRRRRRRGETYPVAEDEIYYSNAPNNFSWDFMYNYIRPNEKYEIQRPQVDRRGYE